MGELKTESDTLIHTSCGSQADSETVQVFARNKKLPIPIRGNSLEGRQDGIGWTRLEEVDEAKDVCVTTWRAIRGTVNLPRFGPILYDIGQFAHTNVELAISSKHTSVAQRYGIVES